ncbi:hypothetical protein [Shimazuella soli]|uniref:hypothetical protein n=1 Tax=Shimazuella soli TaxID=1892854 RepID=UPI001F0E86B7|nr:hypothetical protein [Shimazuella soli]
MVRRLRSRTSRWRIRWSGRSPTTCRPEEELHPPSCNRCPEWSTRCTHPLPDGADPRRARLAGWGQ